MTKKKKEKRINLPERYNPDPDKQIQDVLFYRSILADKSMKTNYILEKKKTLRLGTEKGIGEEGLNLSKKRKEGT